MSLLCASSETLPLDPVHLTDVILDALSDYAFHIANDDSSLLENTLSLADTPLHLGSIHEIQVEQSHTGDGPQKRLIYRTLMLEPASHGYVKPGFTKIIVIQSGATDSSDAVLPSMDSIDSEGIEIDEGFLANTFAPTTLKLNGRNGDSDTQSATSSIDGNQTSQITFDVQPLACPVSVSDDHCTLYIRTVDLGRIGLLNEDWAVATSLPERNYRLVRVVANDTLVATTGTVRGSPILLANILLSADQNPINYPRISLRPSLFGRRQPAIPIAKSVTIARIATPFSINRRYQATYINSLKSYFAASKRLVKSGDIIALPLYNETETIIPEDEIEDTNSTDGQTGEVNELVYFLITNVEHNVISTTSEPNNGQDIYTGSTVGELGCWIDSSATRMAQTGLEHSRIPDIGSYLESDQNHSRGIFAFLKKLPYSNLLRADGPFSKLLSIISATFGRHSVDYNLHTTVLLKGLRGNGKFSVTCWVAQQLGMHILEVDCYNMVGENDVKTEGTLRARFEQASTCSPCILILRNIEALAQTTQTLEAGKDLAIVNALKECISESNSSWKMTGFPVVVAATTSDPARVPVGLLSCFKHEVEIEAPNEEERLEIIQALLSNTLLAPDVSLRELAIQTAALVAIDLSDLVFRAKLSANDQVSSVYRTNNILITARDFEKALKKVRAAYSENIGAPKIPSVTWDDVGGLAHVKTDILDTIQLPLERPELFSDGLKKRSGILLYGPPGTGKTLVAKAVATSCSLNFFSVKGPELLNMYVGESEANVRRVFQRARDAKPCVIFFDELDSVAPKRGNQGDSGGVMDRIVSQLLAEIDGMAGGNSASNVFVIGATNRPDLLDPALLRPGRFDRMLYLGVSETHEAQLNILEALTRKFKMHPDLNLKNVAEMCPFNYTGADFYALCSDAMLNAMSRTAEQLEERIAELNMDENKDNHPYPLTPQYYLAEIASLEEIQVQVIEDDFLIALKNLVPSVSQAEMAHYAQVQRRFSQNVQT